MYMTEDGFTKVEVTFDNDMISRHIKNIFSKGELSWDSVIASFATAGADGIRYHLDFYNLYVIISADLQSF